LPLHDGVDGPEVVAFHRPEFVFNIYVEAYFAPPGPIPVCALKRCMGWLSILTYKDCHLLIARLKVIAVADLKSLSGEHFHKGLHCQISCAAWWPIGVPTIGCEAFAWPIPTIVIADGQCDAVVGAGRLARDPISLVL